jgi:hypothetical protein
VFENLKTAITMILDEIAARPTDRHVLQEELREKIAEMRAMGMPVPEDIEALETALEDPENEELWRSLTT